MTLAEIKQWLTEIKQWQVDEMSATINREFHFKNYYQTIAFVNAIAWISHQQDHHPDLNIAYNRCCVSFSTHSIGGLSINDFICAAKIDATFTTEHGE